MIKVYKDAASGEKSPGFWGWEAASRWSAWIRARQKSTLGSPISQYILQTNPWFRFTTLVQQSLVWNYKLYRTSRLPFF
jgi:hypothetical protein